MKEGDQTRRNQGEKKRELIAGEIEIKTEIETEIVEEAKNEHTEIEDRERREPRISATENTAEVNPPFNLANDE